LAIASTELRIRGDIDEHVDIAVGASCAADYRPEKRERRESTLAQRLLERSKFGNDIVLPRRFTGAPRGRCPFILDMKAQRFADHFATDDLLGHRSGET
jgi:hypothetical protein